MGAAGTTDGAVAVMVDGTFRRAVPADVLPPEAEVLSFARQAGGYGEAFAVMPEGLPAGSLAEGQSTLSQIHPLRRRRRAHIWACLPAPACSMRIPGGN